MFAFSIASSIVSSSEISTKEALLSSLSTSKAYIAFEKNITYYNTTVDYEAGDTYSADASITLYAIWKSASVALTSANVKLGDYIRMTPTSTSYNISSSLTGCNGSLNYWGNVVCDGMTTQTINPSELNLWRVIKINTDGTIEVVSEYTSSVDVWFYGETGYKKFVGTLNTIAAQYINTKYVKSTRHFGYNGQTLNLTSLCTSRTSCAESRGGGDFLYQKDVDLVTAALSTTDAYPVDGSSKYAYYHYASRQWHVLENYSNSWYYRSRGNFFMEDTNEYGSDFVEQAVGGILASGSPGALEGEQCGDHVRPILVLKSGLISSEGDGKSAETAFTLE